MRKFSEYLTEQDKLGMPVPGEEQEDPAVDGEEQEEPAFDIKTAPKAVGSRSPQGMYKVRLKQLTSLPPLGPGQIGMKRSILNYVMRWLQINDISDLTRTERSVERGIRKDWN